MVFYLLCGAPASGKSTFAGNIAKFNYHIVSSDAIRAELYGDESIQQDHAKVFSIARERIINHLKAGHNIVFDATNMKYKDRMATMREVNKFSNVTKCCLIFAEPIEILFERNFLRSRQVPEEVICRMIENFEMPTYAEGFDCIEVVNKTPIPMTSDLRRACSFDQENSNHSLSLLDHCITAARYIRYNTPAEKDSFLYNAALLHDIGKLETKTFFNTKGIETTNAHYYRHENVGAYRVLLYSEPWSNMERIYIAQLVCYHMVPYSVKTEEAIARWRNRIGSKLYDNVLLIHEADVAAH